MKALINQKSELNSRRHPTNFVRWQSFAESLFVRHLLLTLSCLVTPLLVKGDLFQEFTITRAVIAYESFPAVSDYFEISGELLPGVESEGIDPFNEDLRVAVGTSVIEIQAGSFTEGDFGLIKFNGEVNGAEVGLKIGERDDGSFEFNVVADGVDLTETLNPLSIEFRIGNDEGEAVIRLDNELRYVLSDDDHDDFDGHYDFDEDGDEHEEFDEDIDDEEEFNDDIDDDEMDGDDDVDGDHDGDDDVEVNEDEGLSEAAFTLTNIEIYFESFPTINDAFAVRGEIPVDPASDGIDPVNQGVRLAVGTSVIEIPAGSFTEVEPGFFEFKGVINGAEVNFAIIETDDAILVFEVVAEGVDLSETANPVAFNLIIGDNENSALIGLNGELVFEDSDSDEIPDDEYGDNDNDKDVHDDEETDTDEDGLVDAEDEDDDNDGIADSEDDDDDGIVDSDDPDSSENVLSNGNGSQVGSNIKHPNGNVFDQVLLTGLSVEVTADPVQISRVSFIDEDDDIVQVEFFGAGKLTISIDPSSFELPSIPKKYNQEIRYVNGRASVKVDGADASTFLSIFTVGKINAINQGLFPEGETYDAIADIALLEITNSTGFGGILCANTRFSASSGDVGLKAPGIPVSVRVLIGDINASGDAVPYLLFGEGSFTVEAPNPGLRITGGDLLQSNSASIVIAQGESTNPGFEMLTSQNNVKSDGELQPTQSINAIFVNEDDAEVTVLTEEVTIE